MILAGTGHRPQKLGGFGPGTYGRLKDLARAVLTKHKPRVVISGMALGWDQALAEAAIELGIPVQAAIPCKGHSSKWPAESQERYRQILEHPLVTVGYSCLEPYRGELMQRRNKWMVDAADLVVALWDGTPGGTANCVRYAYALERPIHNVWSSWVKFK